jgi:hypothetical protein
MRLNSFRSHQNYDDSRLNEGFLRFLSFLKVQMFLLERFASVGIEKSCLRVIMAGVGSCGSLASLLAMVCGGCATQDHDFTSETPASQQSTEYPDWAKALSLPLSIFPGQSGGYSTGIR